MRTSCQVWASEFFLFFLPSFSPYSSLFLLAPKIDKREGNNMKTSPCLKIERKTSIEDEPRTLTFDQLRYAREAALYVLSTKTIEEAIKIFTEGLEPVLSTRDNMELDKDSDQVLDCVEMEHLNLPVLKRDIVTAPF